MDDSRPADAVSPVIDLTAYDAVILDFDGPMCNVFAGYPAATVAQELIQLADKGADGIEALLDASDPHQIIRLIHRQRPTLAPLIETALTAAEIAAMATATETPGLVALLERLRASQIPVGIASNNNARAIQRWLDQHRLAVRSIVGRDPTDPSKMKPAPDILIEVLSQLQIDRTGTAVFVGDAIADAKAARAAGCAFIGFANKPHKVEWFKGLGCEAVVTSLYQLRA